MLAWQDTQLLLHLVPLGTRIGGCRVLLELPSCAKSCTRARTYQVCMEYELAWIGVAVQIKKKTVVLSELLTSDLAYACVREQGRQQKLPRRCLFNKQAIQICGKWRRNLGPEVLLV